MFYAKFEVNQRELKGGERGWEFYELRRPADGGEKQVSSRLNAGIIGNQSKLLLEQSDLKGLKLKNIIISIIFKFISALHNHRSHIKHGKLGICDRFWFPSNTFRMALQKHENQ